MRDLWIISESRALRKSWRKVIIALLGDVSDRIREFSSVDELPKAPSRGSLAVLLGSPQEKARHYAAWDLWLGENAGDCETTICPTGLRQVCESLGADGDAAQHPQTK